MADLNTYECPHLGCDNVTGKTRDQLESHLQYSHRASNEDIEKILNDQTPKEKYPEAEKWAKVHDKAVAITGFVEWAEDYYADDAIKPPLITQLYRYFEIDADKLEKERSAMIEALQNSQ